MSKIAQTIELGTDFWNDSCHLKELAEAVELGAVGATSNPVIVYNSVDTDRETWMPVLKRLKSEFSGASDREIAWKLIAENIKAAASLLKPAYERTKGLKGFISAQVDPERYSDASKMLEQAMELSKLAPNVAIKAPATQTGISAIEEMSANGVRVNATVSFSFAQAIACAEAMERGLKRFGSAKAIHPYVTLMVGRLDDHLKQLPEAEKAGATEDVLNWSGIAVAKKAYEAFQKRGYRASLLIAAYRHEGHWLELIGPDLVQTVPYKWWKKFDHSDHEVRKSVHEPVDPETLSSLSKIKDFRKAYEENGMKPSEFEHFGASQKTLAQFNEGYQQLLDLVRSSP